MQTSSFQSENPEPRMQGVKINDVWIWYNFVCGAYSMSLAEIINGNIDIFASCVVRTSRKLHTPWKSERVRTAHLLLPFDTLAANISKVNIKSEKIVNRSPARGNVRLLVCRVLMQRMFCSRIPIDFHCSSIAKFICHFPFGLCWTLFLLSRITEYVHIFLFSVTLLSIVLASLLAAGRLKLTKDAMFWFPISFCNDCGLGNRSELHTVAIVNTKMASVQYDY